MSTNIFNSTRPVSTNKMNQTKPFVITDAQAPQAQQNQQQGQKSSVIGPLFFDFKTMSFQPMFDFNKPLVDQQNQWINLQKQKPAQTEEQQPAAANQTVKAQALQPKPEQQQKADLFPEAQGDTAVNSAAAPAGQKDTTDYSQAALEQKMKEQGVVAPQRQYTNQDWDNFRKSRFGQRDDVTVDDDPDTAINMYKSLGVLTDKEKDPPEMVQTAKSKPQDVTYVHPDYREEATKQMFDNYEADKKNVGRLRKLYDTTVDLDQQMLEKRNEAFHEVYDNKDPLAKKNAEHGSWWNPTGILTGLGSALFSKKVYNPETQTYENKAPSDWHELTQNLVRNVATLGSGVHIGRRGRQYTAGYDPTMPMSLLRQQRADAYAPYAEREALRSQLAQDAIRPTTKPWQLDQPYPGVSHPMEGYARAQIDTEMGFRAIQETMKRIQQLRGWTPDSQEYIELENQLLGLTPSILQKARWYVDGLRKTNQFSDQELNRAYVDFLMKEYTGQSLTEQEQAVEAARAKATSDALKSQMEWEDHQSKMATEEANRQLTFAKTQEKVWPLLNKAQGKQLDVNEVQANLPLLLADAQEAIAEGNGAKASTALKRFEAFREGVKGVKLPLKSDDWAQIAETERELQTLAGQTDKTSQSVKNAMAVAAEQRKNKQQETKANNAEDKGTGDKGPKEEPSFWSKDYWLKSPIDYQGTGDVEKKKTSWDAKAYDGNPFTRNNRPYEGDFAYDMDHILDELASLESLYLNGDDTKTQRRKVTRLLRDEDANNEYNLTGSISLANGRKYLLDFYFPEVKVAMDAKRAQNGSAPTYNDFENKYLAILKDNYPHSQDLIFGGRGKKLNRLFIKELYQKYKSTLQ